MAASTLRKTASGTVFREDIAQSLNHDLMEWALKKTSVILKSCQGLKCIQNGEKHSISVYETGDIYI